MMRVVDGCGDCGQFNRYPEKASDMETAGGRSSKMADQSPAVVTTISLAAITGPIGLRADTLDALFLGRPAASSATCVSIWAAANA